MFYLINSFQKKSIFHPLFKNCLMCFSSVPHVPFDCSRLFFQFHLSFCFVSSVYVFCLALTLIKVCSSFHIDCSIHSKNAYGAGRPQSCDNLNPVSKCIFEDSSEARSPSKGHYFDCSIFSL